MERHSFELASSPRRGAAFLLGAGLALCVAPPVIASAPKSCSGGPSAGIAAAAAFESVRTSESARLLESTAAIAPAAGRAGAVGAGAVGAGGPQSAEAAGASTGEATPASADGVPVGLSIEFTDLLIPGSELEVAPIDDTTPVVVRMSAVYPHGDSFRYDLGVYALEAGEFDVLDYLRRKDGSPIEGVEAIPLRVVSILPEGLVRPNELESRGVPTFLRYRFWIAYAALLWVLGLVWIVRSGRKKRGESAAGGPRAATMAERLRPLALRAKAGELDSNGQAELEMLLFAYWRKRRGLQEVGAAEALRRLRGDDEAGPLLRQVEVWLHSPSPSTEVDVEVLLRPYESLPAEDASAPDTRQEVPAG